MKILSSVFVLCFCMFLAGCADMPSPKADVLLKGGNTVRSGMNKSEVRALYGEPDTKRAVVAQNWGSSREEWHYRATISSLPASLGYAGEDAYLYFDGQILTNISDKPLGKSEEVPGDNATKDAGK